MSNQEIKHEFTDEPICPHCGHKVRDSWELGEETKDFECSECEKKFSIYRHTRVDYSTYKLD